jgi:ethanolamine utilization protein EutN
MEIALVIDELVCTRRVPGMGAMALRVVRNEQGQVSVASDPVSCPVGRWVFTTSGSAARLAMPDKAAITDLTICGIIDQWQEGRDAAG